MKHNDENLDRVVKKMMKASKLESPSDDFTNKVMAHVEAWEVKPKITYTPLISMRGFAIIGVLLLISIITLFTIDLELGTSKVNTILNALKFDVSFEFLNIFNQIQFSNIAVYALYLFGLMFAIQIPVLKYYYFERINSK